MLSLIKKLERVVTLVLIAMLCAIVVLATIELAVVFVQDLLSPPIFFPGIDKLLGLFGQVLLVVIGLELVETLRAFASEGVVRVEVVLTVAIIALARKVIILEPDHMSSAVLSAIAALLAALGIVYWTVVRRPISVSGS
jgi:uncharacterized membrane protein (DUF373 family)